MQNRVVPLPGEFVYAVHTGSAILHVFAGNERYTVFAEPVETLGQMIAVANYGYDSDYVNCRWYWPNGKSPVVQQALRHPLFSDCRKVAEDLWKVREVMNG